jgi:hypothetical protein
MVKTMNRLVKIFELVAHFADEDYQRRSWFGIGPEVSSADEMCNGIEDLLLADWVEGNAIDMSPVLYGCFLEFLASVDRLPETRSALQDFASPEWCSVRLKASVIRDLLAKYFDGSL